MVQTESLQSLYIEMFFGETRLASGTAFFVESAVGPILVTNRHNVTGRNQRTNRAMHSKGGIPDKIKVLCVERTHSLSWRWVSIPLKDENDEEIWIEHPSLGSKADFVGLRVELPDDICPFPYTVSEPAQALLIFPSSVLSIIGFPFGQKAGGSLGVWVSGFLASEMDVDFDNQPVFLVHCRSKRGQSGSPVIAKRSGMINYANGNIIGNGDATEFLGIYSGRIDWRSDLGMVWKRSAIKQMIDSIVSASAVSSFTTSTVFDHS